MVVTLRRANALAKNLSAAAQALLLTPVPHGGEWVVVTSHEGDCLPKPQQSAEASKNTSTPPPAC